MTFEFRNFLACALTTLSLAFASAAMGGDEADLLTPQDPTSFAQGLSMKPFVSGSFSSDANAMGGGVNLQYLFTDKVGVGANYAVFAFDDEVHTVSAEIALRYPITRTGLVPYVLVGGGVKAQDGSTDGLVRLGGGIDMKLLNSDLGVFVDGVHNWVSNDEDFTIARLGVRLPY